MAVFVSGPPSAAVLKRQNGDESPVLERGYAAVPLPSSPEPVHSTTHSTTTMSATTTVYNAITVYLPTTCSPSNTTSSPPIGVFSTGVITYPRNVTVPSATSTPLVFSGAGTTLQASALIAGLVSLTALLLI
ncbi:hypothetical protein LZ554_005810 [Drepanopeziza brunnea f. sp. 'monogermtubi']|nr:hypothetical protein LZ554_005810 [Drepanopeziza brunnea f. sp. 'monogermtubi']